MPKKPYDLPQWLIDMPSLHLTVGVPVVHVMGSGREMRLLSDNMFVLSPGSSAGTGVVFNRHRDNVQSCGVYGDRILVDLSTRLGRLYATSLMRKNELSPEAIVSLLKEKLG